MVKQELKKGVYQYGDLIIDTVEKRVTVGELTICTGAHETHLFYQAYDLGREHKKMQIRKSLSI